MYDSMFCLIYEEEKFTVLYHGESVAQHVLTRILRTPDNVDSFSTSSTQVLTCKQMGIVRYVARAHVKCAFAHCMPYKQIITMGRSRDHRIRALYVKLIV